MLVTATAVFTIACKDAKTRIEPANPVEQGSDIETENVETNAQEAQTIQQTQTIPAGKVTLNPPHGEPGHRCDIAVGQPLNSAPVQQTNANVNPPHGQPGHRCDLAVGAPLPE